MPFEQRAGTAGDGQRRRHGVGGVDSNAWRGARVAQNAVDVRELATGHRNTGAARGHAGRKGGGVDRSDAGGREVGQRAAGGGDIARREAVGCRAEGEADGRSLPRYQVGAAAGDAQCRTSAGAVVGIPNGQQVAIGGAVGVAAVGGSGIADESAGFGARRIGISQRGQSQQDAVDGGIAVGVRGVRAAGACDAVDVLVEQGV